MGDRRAEVFDATCVSCGAVFRLSADSALCGECGTSYLDDEGIIVMAAELDSLEKQNQARFFDSAVDPEWEIQRPTGAPRFHQWLLREKLRRGTEGVSLSGTSVLAVCAGSGMDAELLVELGARHVVAVDASYGATRRTRERARRRALPITPVVADAEHLPFPSQSFDIAFVHDGLHHVSDPEGVLREMARIARQAVCVTEPARAAVTTAAVRLGLAEAREEAGNVVIRFTPQEVADVLRACKFRTVTEQRYAMYYRHRPGPISNVLSTRPLFQVTTRVLSLGNSLVGRFGNKMAVTAVREPSS